MTPARQVAQARQAAGQANVRLVRSWLPAMVPKGRQAVVAPAERAPLTNKAETRQDALASVLGALRALDSHPDTTASQRSILREWNWS